MYQDSISSVLCFPSTQAPLPVTSGLEQPCLLTPTCPATLIIFYVHGEGETHRGAPHYGTGGAAPREGTLRSAGTESSKLTRKENRGTSLGGPRQVPRPLPALRFLKGKCSWQVSFLLRMTPAQGSQGNIEFGIELSSILHSSGMRREVDF